MADFGFAYTVPADRDDIRRYKSSWTYGTPGYRAPEIEQKVKGARRDQTPYTLHGSHTDVWSVGKIMMEMYVLVWRHYPADQAAAFRRGEAWAVEEHVYSTGLLALIARCMEADGRRRPTAWRVFDRTWRQVEARRDDLYADEVVSRSIGARNGLWSGKVLMEKEERRMYQDDPVYREAYRDVNLRGLFGKMGTAVETREEEGEFEVVSVPAQPGNVGGPQRGGQGGLVPALGNLNVGRRRKRASGEQRLRAARRARAMQDAMKVIYDPRDEV